MSYGSISGEAHETLAIAMNRIGGKSNTGEGGEDPARYEPLPNGDSRSSAIKQVASGRFGVTSEYLVNAREIQIKMAQGAKPGEGGQLPGSKVYPWIAKTRYSTPGVGLISPPPHHDIYSIEDLKQLIHDLKNANREARISVKLVAEVGVGTVAAGVAKAHADVILISGHDGGTGASPLTSIKHAGIPWELGLAEAHQVLLMNDLRSRVVVEVDGQLKTGRDVVVGALLGAEEFGFATAPLVAMGCVMMRACHLNTCPVGVATQDPELRKRFAGEPEHVVNFMTFIAREVREHMARLGFRTMDEMVGRSDRLEMRPALDHWKARGLDFSRILALPDVPGTYEGRRTMPQQHGVEDVAGCDDPAGAVPRPRSPRACRYAATLPIRNINRTVGTMLGSEVTRRWGRDGPAGRHDRPHFTGSAGQSFGAFIPRGLTLRLERRRQRLRGQGAVGRPDHRPCPPAVPYVHRPRERHRRATSRSTARPAARRSSGASRASGSRSATPGATAVVEGVGDHGCEYMTGGRVLVLGRTGRNFAAGMCGGMAWVLRRGRRRSLPAATRRWWGSSPSPTDPEEAAEVRELLERHARPLPAPSGPLRCSLTGRPTLPRFVRVIPHDYRRVLEAQARMRATGLLRRGGRDGRLRGERARPRPGRGAPDGQADGLHRDPAALAAVASAAGADPGLERGAPTPAPSEELRDQGARCMDCGIPYCHTGVLISGMASGCPINNLIPEWNDLVYRGQWREASIRLHRTNNFPEFTGRVCPAPCEGSCTVGLNGDPVTIKTIEQEIADRAWDEGWITPAPPLTRTGRTVAVVGLRAGGAGRGGRAQPDGPPGHGLRAGRTHRRAADVRHPEHEAGQGRRRPPGSADGGGGRHVPHRRRRGRGRVRRGDRGDLRRRRAGHRARRWPATWRCPAASWAASTWR